MKSLPNLVKQRFVVADESHTRVINSNIKLEEICKNIQKNQNEGAVFPEFSEGIPAPKVGVLSDIDELADEVENQISEETPDFEEMREQILEDARLQAENIVNEARQAAETIKDEAFKEGLAQGEAKADERLQQSELEMKYEYAQKEQELMEAYAQKMEQMEPELVNAFLDIMKQVLFIDKLDYAGIISELMTRTILGLDNPKKVTVYVSPDNFSEMKDMEERLADELGNGAQVEVLRDEKLSVQQCKIETERGIYDCGLDTQLNNLFSRLRALSIRS